jgi:uncharacterized protein (DUF1800 family)
MALDTNIDDNSQETTLSNEPSVDDAANYSSTAALALFSAALLAACGGGGGGDASPSNVGSTNSGAGAGSGGVDPSPKPNATPTPTPSSTSTPAPNSTPTPTSSPSPVPSAPGFNNFPKANSDNEAARFLLQSQLAATETEIAEVRGDSYATYLQKQYAKPITQTGWDWLEFRGYGIEAEAKKYVYNNSIGEYAVWNQLFTAPDVMRKRVALALSEFFVVSFQSMEIDWRGYSIVAFWDLLNKNAFGNFRNLLEDVSLSTAMGYFLNTKGNQKEDPAKGRLPDENYAREIMQLFTIGLYELNLDGTEKIGADGRKIETYDSDDVSQLARVFTGYDFDKSYDNFTGVFTYPIYRREYVRQRMSFDATKHSEKAVNFLNVSIPANTPGPQAMKMALDGLFNHPNVGPFFARQMIQRLVTSNPSPQYVARVAAAFNNNGAGVRGDLKAVWTALLLDDEARGAGNLTSNTFGKVREPIVRFLQWGRSFGVTSKAGSWKIDNLTDTTFGIGQSPFNSPSVFNFFRPGYVPPGTVLADTKATAPEFQIVNETTVGAYINFMRGQIRNGMYTPEPTLAEPLYRNYTLDIVGNYSGELALITHTANPTDADATRCAQALTERLNLRLCAGQLSAASFTVVQTALKAAMLDKKVKAGGVKADEDRRLDWVAAGVLMVMASPDYIVQK